MHGKTSPGTSSSATIRSVSTRRSATEPRKRFTTSTSIGRPQRSQHHNSYPENTGPPTTALNNLGICYSKLGRRTDALPPTEEAVTTYRALAADNPAYLPNLASALNNLGI